jgi:Cof subfamily protein (haloacid dehalogenase superfamily)
MTPLRLRLLISDVDGTLVNGAKVLTPRALTAVSALRAAGVGFTIISARPPQGLAALVEPLDLQLPLAGFNGGAIVTPKLEPIETRVLPADVVADAKALIEAFGLTLWVYTARDWIVPDAAGAEIARERFILGYDPVVRAAARDQDLAGAVKIVGVTGDAAKMAAAGEKAASLFEGRASASRSQSHFLDITHLDANKGFMVEWLCRRLAIRPEEVATIGDMSNDVRMFAKSGFSIAMGNALPDVQAKARAVTSDNENDGFARAVEALLQGRVPRPDSSPTNQNRAP